MRAAILVDVGRVEVADVPARSPGDRDVLVKVESCGVCGSDHHIFTGEGNWNLNEHGRQIPLTDQGQILGHEITGTIVEKGAGVDDLAEGDRVILDQGINCMSAGRESLCEYCSRGSSHLCAQYAEHGITGLPGGFAEFVCIPSVNAIRIETDLPFACAAITEPVACILRAFAKLKSSGGRFTFDAEDEIDRIRTIVIAGGGPAGQIFLQVLRAELGFDGTVILSDPSPLKRSIAEKFGAIAVDIDPGSIEETIRGNSDGRLAELVIDACGVGGIWNDVPTWIRKQASILMYGYGRRGASMELLNALQWREPNVVTPAGASGGFDSDGRPEIYRRSLHMIERGTLDAEALITHRYNGLDCLQQILAHDMTQQEYLKGVLNPSAAT